MRILLGFACLILTAGIGTSKPIKVQPTTLPKGPPPQMAVVHALDLEKGQIELTEVLARLVPVTRTKRVLKDGKNEDVTYTSYQQVWESRVKPFDLAKSEAFDADGNKLERAELTKRLRLGVAVVIAADGREVDPIYRRALAKDAVILVSPTYVLPIPAVGPAPAPPPIKK